MSGTTSFTISKSFIKYHIHLCGTFLDSLFCATCAFKNRKSWPITASKMT